MPTLRDYVNWGMTHCDKTGSAEGVPLVLENCKKNRRMKALDIYGESVQDGTPTPENPIEVESVGELVGIKLDKSLYDDLSQYSVETYYTAYTRMYIEGFKPNTPYYVHVNRLNGSAVNTVKTVMVISGGTFSVAAGGYTVLSHTNGSADYNYSPHTSDSEGRLTIGISTSATQEQLESVLNNVDVYFAETKEESDNVGKYKVPVVVRGKNIFKPTDVGADSIRTGGVLVSKGSYGTTIDSTDFSDNKVTVTQVANESYGTSAYQNGYICFLIPEFTTGERYILSFDVNITSNPLNTSAFVVYACGDSVGAVSLSASTRCKTAFTYKTPPSKRMPQVEIRCGGASFELSNVMITAEGYDETFEPYIEPIVTNVYLNEPLRRIGDYADVLDFKGKKIIRNVYESIITELDTKKYNISTFVPSEGLFCLRILYKGEMLQKYKMPSLYVNDNTFCNMYPVVYSGKRADKTLSGGSNNCATFDFIDSDFSTSDEWDAHLKELNSNGTPLKMIHAIATPYEEPIECELPTLPAKTSIVEIDTTLLPSNIKGKYIKR